MDVRGLYLAQGLASPGLISLTSSQGPTGAPQAGDSVISVTATAVVSGNSIASPQDVTGDFAPTIPVNGVLLQTSGINLAGATLLVLVGKVGT